MTDSGIPFMQSKFFMKRHSLILLPVLLLIFVGILTACQAQNAAVTSTPANPQVTPGIPAGTPAAATPAPTSASAEINKLVIWLPPQFDPEADSATGTLVQSRIDAFQKKYPQWAVEVRLKAVDGRGGLLDSLANTSMAAPDALPAMVALQSQDLESAALKGLLLPLDEKTQSSAGNDWLPYAAQMGMIQGKSFGVPLAGDALILAYHPLLSPYPPSTWQELSSQHFPVIFPAADPDSIVVTTIYQAAGGNLLNQNNPPALEATPLQKSFAILNNGTQSGAFPSWISQFFTFSQAWDTYTHQNSSYAIVWASQYLPDPPGGSKLTTLPKINSTQITLARGWVWCIPAMSTSTQDAALLLVEFFSDPDFINDLDQAAGYLPVNSGGLNVITDSQMKETITKITNIAQLMPTSSTINTISPIFENSTIQIIKKQIYYQQAVDQALSLFKK